MTADELFVFYLRMIRKHTRRRDWRMVEALFRDFGDVMEKGQA